MKAILKATIIFCMISYFNGDRVIKLSGKPELFTTDKLGNCYVFKDNVLTKFALDGKTSLQYTSFESGRLFSIDASDPMQLLLFYKDFNQVVFLDNKLNPIGKPVYLDLIDLSTVSAVCKSKQFAIWIYDEYEHKLIQYGFNTKSIKQTINLDKLNKNIGDIEFMIESGNEIYMNEKNKNIWVFDEFGNKLNSIGLAISKDFQLRNKMLIFNDNNKIFKYNIQTSEKDSSEAEGFGHFDLARIENELLYVLNSDSVTLIPFGGTKKY